MLKGLLTYVSPCFFLWNRLIKKYINLSPSYYISTSSFPHFNFSRVKILARKFYSSEMEKIEENRIIKRTKWARTKKNFCNFIHTLFQFSKLMSLTGERSANQKPRQIQTTAITSAGMLPDITEISRDTFLRLIARKKREKREKCGKRRDEKFWRIIASLLNRLSLGLQPGVSSYFHWFLVSSGQLLSPVGRMPGERKPLTWHDNNRCSVHRITRSFCSLAYHFDLIDTYDPAS